MLIFFFLCANNLEENTRLRSCQMNSEHVTNDVPSSDVISSHTQVSVTTLPSSVSHKDESTGNIIMHVN